MGEFDTLAQPGVDPGVADGSGASQPESSGNNFPVGSTGYYAAPGFVYLLERLTYFLSRRRKRGSDDSLQG